MKPFSLEEFGDSYAEDMKQLLSQARAASTGFNAGPYVGSDESELPQAFALLKDAADAMEPTDELRSSLVTSSISLWDAMKSARHGLGDVGQEVDGVLDDLELMLELELDNNAEEAGKMADDLLARIPVWHAILDADSSVENAGVDFEQFEDHAAGVRHASELINRTLATVAPQGSEAISAHAVSLTRAFHSIRGTSENLRVGSLSRSAAALESLWEVVQARAADFERSAGRISRRMDACLELVDFVTGEQEDSNERREELSHVLQDEDVFSLASDDSLGSGMGFEPSESIFASEMFGESVVGSAGSANNAIPTIDVDPELLDIFREEAATCAEPIDGHLNVLMNRPGEHGSLSELERMYHQLKGAAATVGITAVQEEAYALEEMFEALAANQSPITPDQLADARRRTVAIFQAVSVPFGTTSEVEASAASVADTIAIVPELGRIFAEEGGVACDELDVYLEQIRNLPEGTERPDLVEELRGLLHRLKGSALVSGANEFAGEAARLQAICEGTPAPGEILTEMTSGMPKMRAMLASFADQVAAVESLAASAAGEYDAEFPTAQIPVEVDTESGLWDAFLEETPEIVEGIERELHALEETETPKEVLQSLLRNFHTLKGALNTVALDPLGEIVHHVEEMLEKLAVADMLPPVDRMSSLMFQAIDYIRMNLKLCGEGYVEVRPGYFEHAVAILIGGRAAVANSNVPSFLATATGSAERSDSAGKISSANASATEQRHIRVSADRLDGLMNLVGELVVSRARMERRVDSLKSLLRDLGSSRQRLSGTIEQFREQYEFFGLTGQRIGSRGSALVGAGAGTARRGGGGGGGSWGGGSAGGEDHDGVFSELEMDRYEDINILARSLGEVDNDVTELQSQISHELDLFSEESEAFSTITSGLQGEITTARMIPVDHLFLRVRRPIRDAAQREKKSVRVITSGELVNLDKTIVDDLYTPMLHLVRNSVSHGIEPEAVRLARGKDPTGTVTLNARQESGQILIEVIDDGGGLDLEGLRRKGVERGLIPADLQADHPRVAELIFATGLSTKEVVTGVSGRGVGCDVVRREIERMNGHIRVQTVAGRGTVFSITMPLTLAIYRALLVSSQGMTYAIPLSFADRTMSVADRHVVTSAGVDRVEVDGDFVAIRDMASVLRVGREENDKPNSLVLLRLGDRSIGLGVDQVLGQEEIVVKSLGDVLTGHPLFSGVTISGDGDLMLIMDVPGLFETVGTSDIATIGGDALGADVFGDKREAAGGSRPARVLYVDDSLSVRKAAEKFLTGLGVDVTLAVDGVDGMEKLRHGTFDMVFTDLEMPRLHGFDLIRDIRFIPQFQDLPIVVVTSRSGDKHRAQAQKLGASDYVTKPFTQETLEKMIVQLVNASREGNRLVCQR